MRMVSKSDPVRGEEWRQTIAQRAPDLDLHIRPDMGNPAEVRYLVAVLRNIERHQQGLSLLNVIDRKRGY